MHFKRFQCITGKKERHEIEKNAVRDAATTFIRRMSAGLSHRERWNYLNFCGVSPLYDPARLAAHRFDELHSRNGALVFTEYPDITGQLRASAGRLLRTDPQNVSFVRNTAEGLSMIAAGYPLQSGDEIVSYVHEYPSNHYPWVMTEKRGARLKLIQNSTYGLLNPDSGMSLPGPCSFSLDDIDAVVTPRTKILSISHVQFTSGFACNLRKIGEYCRDRNIDLVIDAAQSLGALPLYPDLWHISAIAASGWKWLLGPIGCGLLYTSPEFREKIQIVMTGADLMQQGQDYLNHTWNPFTDGRKFEYSTLPVSLAVALKVCIDDLPLGHGIENVRDHIFHMHDVFLKLLDQSEPHVKERIWPLCFSSEHRSGILSLVVPEPDKVSRKLRERGIVCTVRGGYLRLAPHLPTTSEDMEKFFSELASIV
jgi:selenocysteine lyase/cysteine desulfurase